MRKDQYEPGDVLCDMHDRFKHLPDNLAPVTDSICTIEAANSGEWIENTITDAIGKPFKYTNKMLVVMPKPPMSPSSHLVAAYSYDGLRIAIMRLEYC